MAYIITVAQQKGGATKTTTAMNLAGAFVEIGFKVKVADMNHEQGSAINWANRGSDFKNIVISISEKIPRNDIEQLRNGLDFIIIDTPPELSTPALKAVLLSDLIIIPCMPAPDDLGCAAETVDLAQETKKMFRLLPSRVQSNTSLGKGLRETLIKLGDTFETTIHHRIAIVEAAVLGTWIGAYDPECDSHIEYRSLVQEIIDIWAEQI